MKRSEEEIRKALNHFTCKDDEFVLSMIQKCCGESSLILEAAIEELLTLRRRMEDRDALAVQILNYNHLPASGLARVIASYLEGKDGE